MSQIHGSHRKANPSEVVDVFEKVGSAQAQPGGLSGYQKAGYRALLVMNKLSGMFYFLKAR